MVEQKKHKCNVLICPDCGAKYSAKQMEMLVFVPFNMRGKGKRNEARGDAPRAPE